MTAYYFAARYDRHPEMRAYRDQLEAIGGVKVVSWWIDTPDDEAEGSFTPERLAANPSDCWRYALQDLDDLNEADVLVNFTGQGGGGKGGRHVEYGFFLALYPGWPSRMRIVIVGPRENVFHCHPSVEVYPDFETFLTHERTSRGTQ